LRSSLKFDINIIMIRNITKIFSAAFLGQPKYYSFCTKTDILKTYLEIIPPHRIYELKEKKEHKL